MKAKTSKLLLASLLVGAGLILPQTLRAHCDTMDGPVVGTAKAALENKDLTPVLKWVKKQDEAEIKTAFAKTLAVRSQGAEVRELADQFFFETLVRVHRAGEGAPFTGLKPAGTKFSPAIEGADKALESGAVDAVVKQVTDDVTAGIRKRFAEAREKKAHAEHNVAAGREFVAAYVEFIHYIEALDTTARRNAESHGHSESEPLPAAAGHQHNH